MTLGSVSVRHHLRNQSKLPRYCTPLHPQQNHVFLSLPCFTEHTNQNKPSKPSQPKVNTQFEGLDIRLSFSAWWFQPIWKICSSNWIISPGRGENKTYLKPPPSWFFGPRYHIFFFQIHIFRGSNFVKAWVHDGCRAARTHHEGAGNESPFWTSEVFVLLCR